MKEKFFELFTKKSPEMFYIIGLIFGDGCVHYNKTTSKYYTNLTSQDLDLLENFNNFFGQKYHIKKAKNTNAYRINIWSKPLCEALFDIYKLRNKKSNNLIYPDIPVELEKYFIVGLHATDGSNPILTIKKKYKDKIYINKTIEWNYTSCSKYFIEKINEVIYRNTKVLPAKINVREHEVGNTSYSIKYFGKKAEIICNWMYDCPDWMRCKRKYQMFLDYKLLRKIV